MTATEQNRLLNLRRAARALGWALIHFYGAKEADAKPAAMARAMILFGICILLERTGGCSFRVA
jgi:hypothetical protein